MARKKQPQKMIVSDYLEDVSAWTFDATLEDIKLLISNWETKYGNDGLYLDYDGYGESPRFNLYRKREETDKEFKERVARDEMVKQSHVERELAEYKRLREIYGKVVDERNSS